MIEPHAAGSLHDGFEDKCRQFFVMGFYGFPKRSDTGGIPFVVESAGGRRDKIAGGERIPENGVHTSYRVAHRHGIPSVAMIPRPYGDEVAFRGLSAGVPILYSHFHGDFDRYGTRIAIKYVLHGRGYDLQKQFPEVDRRLVGESTEHDVRHFF